MLVLSLDDLTLSVWCWNPPTIFVWLCGYYLSFFVSHKIGSTCFMNLGASIWVHIYLESTVFLLNWALYHYVVSVFFVFVFVSFNCCWFKVCFTWYNNSDPYSLWFSIFMTDLSPTLYFKPMDVITCKMDLLNIADRWVLFLFLFFSF